MRNALISGLEKTVEQRDETIYITWSRLTWDYVASSRQWHFKRMLASGGMSYTLFTVSASVLIEDPLMMFSFKGPCMVRLRFNHTNAARFVQEMLISKGARNVTLFDQKIETRTKIAFNDDILDRGCDECWGTGSYKGWGADCSRGCKR